MATTIAATKTAGPTVKPASGVEYEFTLVFDTSDASGLLTCDLTDYFSYLHSAVISGSLAGTGYVCEVQKIVKTTALTATNFKILVLEAGADAGPLDPLASTDLEAVITGLTLTCVGKPALETSWS